MNPEDHIVTLNVIIYKEGKIYRESFNLGEYSEEKNNDGYYERLKMQYPENFASNIGTIENGIMVWPTVSQKPIEPDHVPFLHPQ